MKLTTRFAERVPNSSGKYRHVTRTVNWPPEQSAIIVTDMWDRHHCRSARERIEQMALHMNEVLAAARRQGLLIVHAPSDCMNFYEGSPQRLMAQEAPQGDLNIGLGPHLRRRNPEKEPQLPIQAGCSCDSRDPCGAAVKSWTRQIEHIEIAAQDAVTDKGVEIYSLLAQRNVQNVILMGAHVNVCMLNKPWGLRAMIRVGKNTVLCRDLTDSYHRGPGRHFEGLYAAIAHIERYVCPTITSTDLAEGPAFKFRDDRAWRTHGNVA